MNPLIIGIILCIFSQILFSSLFLFSYAMQPLSGVSIFALRIIVTFFGFWLLTLLSSQRKEILPFIRQNLAHRSKTGQ